MATLPGNHLSEIFIQLQDVSRADLLHWLLPQTAAVVEKPMPTSSSKPDKRFRRTRDDHASETAEDYVEAIAEQIDSTGECRGADLARQFGVSHVTVTKTIARLQSEGLVDTEPYAPLALTRKGRALADASRKRHAVVLEFLLALGVSPAVAEVDAEGIEHHVSDETLRCFRELINRQKESSDGGESPS